MSDKVLEDFMFLNDLLRNKRNEQQTFEAISSQVKKRFDKSHYLSVGTLIIMLIRHGELSNIMQKLMAYYVIFDLFREDDQTETPFMIFFVDILSQRELIQPQTRLHAMEKIFISQLINGHIEGLAKQTPSSILKSDMSKVSPINLPYLRNLCLEQKFEFPTTARSGVMNVLPIVGQTPMTNSDSYIKDLCLSANTPLENTFSPQFMSVAPPLLPYEDELIWFNLSNRAYHKPVYDSSSNIGIQAKRLIEQAFKQALSLTDQQLLLDELKKDSNLVYQIGLTPNKLPDLVENNPLISIEILLKLMNSIQITEYFNILVNMEITLHSMEVVNRLTTSVNLPTEFVHLYINNCMTTCSTMKDKYLQARLVRLVCVFLQSLIRNKIINVKDLFIEVETFCVEFSRIKEAVALYRLLKHLELGENTTTNTTTTTTATVQKSKE